MLWKCRQHHCSNLSFMRDSAGRIEHFQCLLSSVGTERMAQSLEQQVHDLSLISMNFVPKEMCLERILKVQGVSDSH